MYRIENEIMAIREVQKYLFLIGDENPERLKIAVDGIYSENTALSVKEFQTLSGLFPSGEVDKETFDRIYEEYYAIKRKRDRESKVPLWNGDLSLGSTGEYTSILNLTLLSLGEFYKDIPAVREESFFSRATEQGVKFMQSVFGLEESGIVTLEIYLRILEEAQRAKRFKSYSLSVN